LALRIDGQAASATTVARKRAVFSGALKYAVELRLLDVHPLMQVTWIAPKSMEEVGRRTVVNPRSAWVLLAAVRDQPPELDAFFGCMYYAALRPEEALHLREDEY
jgi:integrase